MRITHFTDPDFATHLRALDRHAEASPEVQKTVSGVIAKVRVQGDLAVVHFTKKFGGPALTPETLRVSPEELAEARREVSPQTLAALEASHRNVLAFAKKSLRKDWQAKNAQGAQVGERFLPFRRVGIYVPGGTAPLVSTAIMTCTLGQAAGVPEMVVTTPADISGKVNAALLTALELSGATEIYRIGGAQAIAAVAFGTGNIRPVEKIFGPGNAYVVEAKRQVFGRVAVDLLPGPSEIMIIGDAGAPADWIGADLLAQAEHGKGSAAILVTPSKKLARAVEKSIQKQLKTLSRRTYLEPVLQENAYIIVAKNLEQCVELANAYAPEHLTIMAEEREEELAAQVLTAGAIFLGAHSPVAAGDFLAGPSHELPTGGAGKSFPGLTVDQFQRRTSLVRLDAAAIAKSAPIIEKFGEIEGLDAHARSATIRVGTR